MRKIVNNHRNCLELVAFFLLLLSSLTARADFEPRFYVYNAANGLADNSAQTVSCTKTGRLVITTMGQINFFNGQRFQYIDPTSENIYPLASYKGNYHLYFDRYHHLWLKNTHTVTCVNLTTERFVESIEEVFSSFGVTQKVNDLFVDSDNIVWLVLADGMLYNVETRHTFTLRTGHNLQDLEVWDGGLLLLFYEDGTLDVVNQADGKMVSESCPYDAKTAGLYDQTSVLLKLDDTIYQARNGQGGGILQGYHVATGKWHTVLKIPYNISGMTPHDGIIYIPTGYGYWTYGLVDGQLKHYEDITMANDGHKMLTSMNAIAFDLQGGMWVGTELRGLLYARPAAAPFHVFDWENPRALQLYNRLESELKNVTLATSYRGKPVNCVFHDSRGWTWVGTSQGLQAYRNNSDQLPQLFTRRDGLQNNVIRSIIEDEMHNIWVATSYGICCLMMDNDKLRHIISYNQWDGIPNESFVNGRVARLADGTIIMQSLDHMVEFTPSKMATIKGDSRFEIHPKLIRLLINGNEVRTGQEVDGRVILEKALPRTKEIDLNYNQNSVSLTFSAMNYFRPEQTYYRLRIEGLDDTWRVMTPYGSGGLVDRQGQLHLPMLGLQPGTYHIYVQASMLPDYWPDEPYEWIVKVSQPWWRSTGMFLLLALVLLSLLTVNAILFIRNANMKARRNNGEHSLMKRLKSFVGDSNRQQLAVLPNEVTSDIIEASSELSPEFIRVMIKLMPFINKQDVRRLSMRELSTQADMDVVKFYSLVNANVYKNPRAFFMAVGMQRAEELLRTTDMGIAEIARACDFATPNYFIASFYRKHHVTPEEWRRQ